MDWAREIGDWPANLVHTKGITTVGELRGIGDFRHHHDIGRILISILVNWSFPSFPPRGLCTDDTNDDEIKEHKQAFIIP